MSTTMVLPMRSLRKRLCMKLRLNLHTAHNPIMFSTNLDFDLPKLPILINLHILKLSIELLLAVLVPRKENLNQ